jgi:hypothetical protein
LLTKPRLRRLLDVTMRAEPLHVLTWVGGCLWSRMCWSVRHVDGRPGRLSSVTLVLPSLKRSIHSQIFRWCMVRAPYCANIRQWISADLTPSVHRKRTTARCSLMVQSLNGAPILLPSLLSTMSLKNGMLRAASYTSSLVHMWCCASAPLSCFYRKISKLPLLSDSPTHLPIYKYLPSFPLLPIKA